MTTDLVIGIASSYTWYEIRPFVVSLRRSGYQGRAVLIRGFGPCDPVDPNDKMHRRDDEVPLVPKLEQYGIEVLDIGEFDKHPILIRFPVIAKFIDDNPDEFRYVLAVDTKDIVFQSDPTVWLANRLGDKRIAVASEIHTYESNGGNNRNIREAFGDAAYHEMKNEEVMNAGVISGWPRDVRDLLLQTYDLAHEDNRLKVGAVVGYQQMIADQTAMNIILRRPEWKSRTLFAGPQDGFVFEYSHVPASVYRDQTIYPKRSEVPYAMFHQYVYNNNWWNDVKSRYQ